MNKTNSLILFLFSALLFSASNAQDTADEEADVLYTIGQQWAAEQNGDKKWIQRMLSDDFMGWGKSSPAPRNKESTQNWNRFDAETSRMVQHELYHLSVTVHEDVAIAHYLYTSANKDKDGDVETTNGRYTDVLVRTDDGWKFIAWHGGDD